MQKKTILFLFSLVLLFFSCSEKQSDTSDPIVQESAESVQTDESTTGQAVEAEVESSFEPVPAVVLRDDASIWENEEGNLSAKPLTTLDMGTEVKFLGEKEDLKSGSKTYNYSKIDLGNGAIGWISTVRLAINAKPGVLITQTGLYSRPSVTSPIDKNLPSGQLVAVSLENGLFENFALVTYSYYTGDKISVPESYYVPVKVISSDQEDIDTAKLVLKAFRKDELRNDFFNLAIDELQSNFKVTGTVKPNQNGFKYPEMDDNPLQLPNEVDILAVNPQVNGESQPWYLTKTEDGQLAWVMVTSVNITSDPVKNVVGRPQLLDKSSYKGEGKQSVILYPGLSFRSLVKDENGKESLSLISSLELAQVVYYMGENRVFNDIEYSRIELADGTSGWCSASYLAIDTVPAVITGSDVSQFKEAKLTALSPVRLQRFQIIALSLKEESGFFKVSYLPLDKEIPLQKDVYLQKTSAPTSYMKDDIDATLLFQMCLDSEDAMLSDLYLRKAAEIPSFFQNEISDLFYEAKGISDSQTDESEESE